MWPLDPFVRLLLHILTLRSNMKFPLSKWLRDAAGKCVRGKLLGTDLCPWSCLALLFNATTSLNVPGNNPLNTPEMEKIKPHVPILTPQICIFPLYTSVFQHKLTLYQQHLFYDIVQRAAEICHFQANTIKQMVQPLMSQKNWKGSKYWLEIPGMVWNTSSRYQGYLRVTHGTVCRIWRFA